MLKYSRNARSCNSLWLNDAIWSTMARKACCLTALRTDNDLSSMGPEASPWEKCAGKTNDINPYDEWYRHVTHSIYAQQLGNTHLLYSTGFSLVDWGLQGLAFHATKKVKAIRIPKIVRLVYDTSVCTSYKIFVNRLGLKSALRKIKYCELV